MSCRSSALVRMHYTFPPEVELAVRSDAMFEAWPELTGRPCCIRRTGFARIVAPGEESALRANLAMQRALGARAEEIDAAGLTELAPGFCVDDISCAGWEPDGGYGDGAVVAGDLLAAARARGVRYRPGTRVHGLVRDGDRVTGVRVGADSETEHAGTVILAAGVWSPALARTVGLCLPIETELHQVAVLAHPRWAGAPFACIDSVTQTYFRPEAAGAMTLVGSFAGPRGARPGSAFPDTASAEDLAPQVQRASHRVPALADAGIARGVTGVYDMTPDARPLLGRAARTGRADHCRGLLRHGIQDRSRRRRESCRADRRAAARQRRPDTVPAEPFRRGIADPAAAPLFRRLTRRGRQAWRRRR